MIREHRYTVLKNKDIEQAVHSGYLTASDFLKLQDILAKVEMHRAVYKDQGPLQCVVVESDWPEYEPTWNAIEGRVLMQESYL